MRSPVVDDELVIDPEADAVIGLGVEGVSLGILGDDPTGPAHGVVVVADEVGEGGVRYRGVVDEGIDAGFLQGVEVNSIVIAGQETTGVGVGSLFDVNDFGLGIRTVRAGAEQHPVARNHDVLVGMGDELIFSVRGLGEGNIEEALVRADAMGDGNHPDHGKALQVCGAFDLKNRAQGNRIGCLGEHGAGNGVVAGIKESGWGQDLGVGVGCGAIGIGSAGKEAATP